MKKTSKILSVILSVALILTFTITVNAGSWQDYIGEDGLCTISSTERLMVVNQTTEINYVKSQFDGQNIVFEYPLTGSCYLEKVLWGDINQDGYLDIQDVSYIQKALALRTNLTNNQEIIADYNGDSHLDIRDVTAIQISLLQ